MSSRWSQSSSRSRRYGHLPASRTVNNIPTVRISGRDCSVATFITRQICSWVVRTPLVRLALRRRQPPGSATLRKQVQRAWHTKTSIRTSSAKVFQESNGSRELQRCRWLVSNLDWPERGREGGYACKINHGEGICENCFGARWVPAYEIAHIRLFETH